MNTNRIFYTLAGTAALFVSLVLVLNFIQGLMH